ncbi:hypothetical protein BHE97_16555 [Aeromicrobium sp. PE09-221]|uniref:(2Fe-2S)-binding protein n=1 Tax=Aeromicrobium sp. PE09-221 TaxID=1898043 RepID=UPI000B3EBFF8|nr:(2Fe-2S)-binding protein [Aeromicrobium sp. PE09-221]OUZ07558.1 hypothetical protein BHE97_16555 [Aeromicrobium sp. PE09-221]
MDPLAALGPYFAVEREVVGEGWLALDGLRDDVLAERVAHARDALAERARADVEDRVAASIMSLGLFARAVSPVLGSLALGEMPPRIDLFSTHWRPVDSGPWPIAVQPGQPRTLDEVITGVIGPLAERIGADFSVSRTILDGNAASAVFGAVTMLRRAGADREGRALAAALNLLGRGPLRGTGAVDGVFTRTSCCLYYRLPGGGYCGDCVLAAR